MTDRRGSGVGHCHLTVVASAAEIVEKEERDRLDQIGARAGFGFAGSVAKRALRHPFDDGLSTGVTVLVGASTPLANSGLETPPASIRLETPERAVSSEGVAMSATTTSSPPGLQTTGRQQRATLRP